ncbi:DNA polymerase delta, subunit 4-domain-containing protein [Pisolithus croceorrhizus]|nr:DNA polymerase delta, subunit 4-domain-containing protein [Pisolithus sp. B1]KAI6114792.1 DNA polymerase delta, subunit 4-domain-containing protein [Pisolithus croceorrhizus]KAI6126453.1 DNA polymerase delta, subunit 4-domain-containing protein [Pisolithus croceorrhizus]KAI6164663.1 DNA polymerase delta, subunit 4-domain-containing protein [Pisolithus thermaeus]
MAPTRNTSRMKQGTLSFQAAKRANSGLNTKSQKSVASSSSKQVEDGKPKKLEDKNDNTLVEELDIETLNRPSVEVLPSSIPSKRTRDGVQPQRGSRQKHTPKKVEGVPATPEPEHLDVEDKAGHYRRYYKEVREKMGYANAIHGNGGNKIIQMLRFFDMTYEYGPCVGMTRLERWERAEALGLNPPPEIRHILSTKEGMEKEEYVQCVLFGEV